MDNLLQVIQRGSPWRSDGFFVLLTCDLNFPVTAKGNLMKRFVIHYESNFKVTSTPPKTPSRWRVVSAVVERLAMGIAGVVVAKMFHL